MKLTLSYMELLCTHFRSLVQELGLLSLPPSHSCTVMEAWSLSMLWEEGRMGMRMISWMPCRLSQKTILSSAPCLMVNIDRSGIRSSCAVCDTRLLWVHAAFSLMICLLFRVKIHICCLDFNGGAMTWYQVQPLWELMLHILLEPPLQRESYVQVSMASLGSYSPNAVTDSYLLLQGFCKQSSFLSEWILLTKYRNIPQ